MVRKKPYIIAGIVSFVIFLMGFLMGFALLNVQLEELRMDMEKGELELRNIQLEIAFLGTLKNETFCSYMTDRLGVLDKGTAELGNKLINPKGLTEKYFDMIKRRYTAFLIQGWLFSEELVERCNATRIDVMYFYEQDCDPCMSQGYVLDYLVSLDKGENVHIFAIDRKLDEPIVQMLTQNFNVTEAPVLIINDIKYDGFQTKEIIMDIFCSMDNNLAFC